MSLPTRPGPERTPRAANSLKSMLVAVALLIISVGAGAQLDIRPSEFASGATWSNMADIVIRMGPFFRINDCALAEEAWGPANPATGKSDPERVRRVCDEEKVYYIFWRNTLDQQTAFLSDIWAPLIDTFRMAIIGAFFGALLAVPFALLAARNLVTFKPVYFVVRALLNVIRTVPDLVWAALMAGAFGIGALPGVLALSVFSFGLNAKLLSESIETIDPGPLEAMQACGANRLQQIRYGVVPQVLPQFLAYAMYVLEIDVRASTVLGLVGAGGIGVLFKQELSFRRYPNVGVIVLVMLVAVVLMDFISTKVRERLV